MKFHLNCSWPDSSTSGALHQHHRGQSSIPVQARIFQAFLCYCLSSIAKLQRSLTLELLPSFKCNFINLITREFITKCKCPSYKQLILHFCPGNPSRVNYISSRMTSANNEYMSAIAWLNFYHGDIQYIYSE